LKDILTIATIVNLFFAGGISLNASEYDQPIEITKTALKHKEVHTIEEVINIQQKAILKLLDEVKYLKKEIQVIKSGITKKRTVMPIKHDTNVKEKSNFFVKTIDRIGGIDTYKLPYNHTKTKIKLPNKQVLMIEYCNNRKWCKIKDKDLFVKEYLLK